MQNSPPTNQRQCHGARNSNILFRFLRQTLTCHLFCALALLCSCETGTKATEEVTSKHDYQVKRKQDYRSNGHGKLRRSGVHRRTLQKISEKKLMESESEVQKNNKQLVGSSSEMRSLSKLENHHKRDDDDNDKSCDPCVEDGPFRKRKYHFYILHDVSNAGFYDFFGGGGSSDSQEIAPVFGGGGTNEITTPDITTPDTNATVVPSPPPIVAITVAPTPLGASALPATAVPGSTSAPTTVAPPTVAPTTVAPTTLAPTTLAPTTSIPVVIRSASSAILILGVTTLAPASLVSSALPATAVPGSTVAPTIVAPMTSATVGSAPLLSRMHTFLLRLFHME